MRLIPIQINPIEITITADDILDDLLYPNPREGAGVKAGAR